MRILLVGSLSWNPERMLSLCEQGHELFGLWGRSMDWDQGPYPVLDGAVTSIQPDAAVDAIRERDIECVYGLYQAPPRHLWGPPQPGVEHELGVWDLLRQLLAERARGRIDLPIVQHYGYDVGVFDAGVARALDGHIFCNEHKLRYWSSADAEGGLGIDAFGDPRKLTFLDGDLPKAEFMNDRFSPRLSDGDGEIHTVCVGRPVGIDVLAAARRGIHVHVYGNAVDEVHRNLAYDIPERALRWHRARLRRYLHVHSSRQAIGASRSEVWRVKSRWVEEFSRYDAGWSYVRTPVHFEPQDDPGAIPNRLGTYLLAGLPVITDARPGSHRHDLLQEVGVGVVLGAGYDELRGALEAEIATREKSRRAREVRRRFSFDAGVPGLVAALLEARERYFARPLAERICFEDRGGPVELWPAPRSGAAVEGDAEPGGRRERSGRHARRRKAGRLAAILEAAPASSGASTGRAAEPARRRIAAFERFDAASRRCGMLADEKGVELCPLELHRIDRDPWMRASIFLSAAGWWLLSPLRVRQPLRLFLACLRSPHVRAGALCRVPEAARRVRAGRIDELACFSAKGLEFVPMLADGLGIPCTEVLATGTQYLGEFAYEMLAVVPYAYWLHRQGRLRRTVGRPDTRCLYYFSDDHRELPGERSFVPITEYPVGEIGERSFDKASFPARLDTSCWEPPPYGDHFRDERFSWSRPTCVVCNKTSEENYLGGPRVNSIETQLLLEIVDRLRTRYQVVYDRPRSADIVDDHQRVGEIGDIEALTRRHPDVLTIQALHARHPELSFNELQLRVFAGCRRFVSVLGGSSYLASWFGGVNVVYARGGWEVECGAFENWFGAFSGARVIAVSTPESLRSAIERELL